MPTTYDRVRTLAYRINPDVASLPFTCQVVSFPEAWKRALMPLQRTQTDRSEEGVTLQVYALNACLLAVCPDILYISRGVGKLEAPTPWIYGLQQIPAQTLRDLVALWVHYTYTKVALDRRAEVIAGLDPSALVWREHAVDLAQWDKTEGGTALERDQSQYTLLAQFTAATLCAPSVPLMHGSEPLTFQRAAPAPGKNSARLVAWPPLDHDGDAYSPFLTIATHTVAFQGYPALHIDYGLIRWLSTPQASLPGGRTSVFLRSQVPWIPGVLPSAHFQAAQVRWRKHNGGFQLVWDGMIAELLSQVDMPEIVDPNDLVANPRPFLHPESSFNAAIVFRNGMRGGNGQKKLQHAVGTGYGPADRVRMADQLAGALKPIFGFTPELPRVVRTQPPVQVAFNNPFGLTLVKSTDDMEEEALIAAAEANAAVQTQRRAYLGRIAQDNSFVIEIWYQEEQTQIALRSVLATEFGLDTSSSTLSRWETPEVTIELRAIPFGRHCRPLSDTNRPLMHRDAITVRAEEVRAWLDGVAPPAFALMELDGADSFSRRTDPRPALRMGGALAGRITQQFRPVRRKEDLKNLDHRLRMAILDAIRQRGQQPQALVTSGAVQSIDGDGDGPNLVGVWLIKTYAKHSSTGQAAHIPFVVLLPAGQTEILCRAPGWSDWRPYAEGLMALARNDATSYPKVRDAARFLATTIEQDLTAIGPSIVMVFRRNLSEAWPYVANKYLVPDKIRFGSEDLRPISSMPGLRLLRLRDAVDQETPEWVASNGTQVSVTKGLFQIGERVFASTYARPKQFKISSERSKTQAYQVKHPKTKQIVIKEADPSAYSWNPAITEITVAAMQPGDDPARLAFVPHILRAQAVHFDEALALPLPLHLAKLAQEYVIPVDYEREDDGDVRQLSMFRDLE
jgi:hypothetical protein